MVRLDRTRIETFAHLAPNPARRLPNSASRCSYCDAFGRKRPRCPRRVRHAPACRRLGHACGRAGREPSYMMLRPAVHTPGHHGRSESLALHVHQSAPRLNSWAKYREAFPTERRWTLRWSTQFTDLLRIGYGLTVRLRLLAGVAGR